MVLASINVEICDQTHHLFSFLIHLFPEWVTIQQNIDVALFWLTWTKNLTMNKINIHESDFAEVTIRSSCSVGPIISTFIPSFPLSLLLPLSMSMKLVGAYSALHSGVVPFASTSTMLHWGMWCPHGCLSATPVVGTWDLHHVWGWWPLYSRMVMAAQLCTVIDQFR